MRCVRPLLTSELVLALFLAAGSSALAQNYKAPTFDEVFQELGYSNADKQAVMNGEIVSIDYERTRDDQLVAAVALPVKASLAELAASLEDGRNIAGEKDTIAWGPVPTGEVSDFGALTYDDKDSGEVRSLVALKADSQFNFSREEREFLKEALKNVASRDPATIEKVSAAYRELLSRRTKAYMEGGLVAVAPYDHGGKELSPVDQLRVEEEEGEGFMTRHFPTFWRALTNFPQDQLPDISSEFYWIKKNVEGRAAFVLMHQMVESRDDFLLVSQRQFYVGHNYESLQMVGLAMPSDSGSMIFSVNAVFTNQITGFFSGMAQSVGQKRTRESMEKHFQAVQKEVQ